MVRFDLRCSVTTDTKSRERSRRDRLVRGAVDSFRRASLVLLDANYDDESGQVKVRAKNSSSIAITKLAIGYNVNILAELPGF